MKKSRANRHDLHGFSYVIKRRKSIMPVAGKTYRFPIVRLDFVLFVFVGRHQVTQYEKTKLLQRKGLGYKMFPAKPSNVKGCLCVIVEALPSLSP